MPPILDLSEHCFMCNSASGPNGRSTLFSERWSTLSLKMPSKKPRYACILDLLSFLCYLELCVQIFRRDLSAPETHESGVYHFVFF